MKSAEARVLRASSGLPGKLQLTSPPQPVEQRSHLVVVVGDEPVQGKPPLRP
jgi:hypothetical protein